MNIIFFGSTTDSVNVAQILHKAYPLAAVVTQPEKPTGRKQTVTKTPLERWAIDQKIPCLSFPQDEDHPWKFQQEDDVTNSLSSFKPNLFVTACYGQKLPAATLGLPTHGSLNIHPSLLPRWRGADPVPWTIIAGDAQTGVTISLVTDTFDSGNIVAQKKIPLTDHDTPDAVRTALFELGAHLLVETLPTYLKGNCDETTQKKEDVVIARKLTRDDGFVPWKLLQEAITGNDIPRQERNCLLQEIQEPLIPAILRLHRALAPWPGIWTKISLSGVEKRVKLLALQQHDKRLLLDTVQLEGKNPTPWNTFRDAYLP